MKVQFLSRRHHFRLLCDELATYSLQCEIINNKKSRNFLTLPSEYYLNSLKSDLLVTHNPYHGLYGAIKAKKAGKVDHVAFRLKADHWSEQQSTELSLSHRLGYIIKKRQYNQSISEVDFVIAISEYMQNVASSHGLDKPIYLMYNGVDTERFRERKCDGNYQSELLCVMNFNIPQKIQLFKHFLEIYSELNLRYHITVLGDGSLLPSIQSYVKKLGLSEKVSFKGYVDNVELYYSNCDLVIHPSSLESFGMSLLEAGASAKPCIASNVGAIHEIILNNQTGYLTNTLSEFIDRIDSLMSDNEKRLTMGKKALNRVHETFTWKHSAEVFINILKKENLLSGEI